MGAPFKGKEATQGQIAARLALARRNRRQRKYSHYVGLGEDGQTQYRAPCGHIVGNPSARMCWGCRHANRPADSNPYVGRDERGQSWFTATCGHLVRNVKTAQCRKCWNRERARTRNPRHNPYRRHPGVGNVPEHRVIAERVLGRKLRRGEVVHHINMDKTDNRNCNLLICSAEYHKYLHHAMAAAYAMGCAPPKPKE